MAKTRIGLFGGAFNPVHFGHLIIAETLREELHLAKVIFIPAHLHPFKDKSTLVSPEHRLNMLRLAIEDNPSFDYSTVEFERGNISYTIDTVNAMRRIYPGETHDLFFLVGADNLADFPRWRKADELVKRCQFVAFGRPGFNPNLDSRYEHLARAILAVECPLLELSSTEIRTRLKKSRSIRYLLPEKVAEYIALHRLYQ